ncbi:MAG: PAS domain S-box protein [Maridesulfovibrio ferrireducens]|nr:PAS domain S-box protein [Maridesulfovibrio ferrireducens]MBI9113361.1 PAS domain S-box protein [Maridesulfovibrio ferrireducens]
MNKHNNGKGTYVSMPFLKEERSLIDAITERVERIIERKQAEDALKCSESKFRSYIENAPYGIFVADENGNYVDINEAASRITGYSQAELLTMNLIDLISSEDHEKAAESFETVVKTGHSTYELHFETKDGSKRIWVVNAVKLSDNKFLGFVADITERKHADERIQYLNLVLSTIRNVNQLIVMEKNSDVLIQKVCDILTENRGYANAWIVLLDEHGKYINSAESGLGKDFTTMRTMLEDGKLTNCGNKVLKTKDMVVTEDPAKDTGRGCYSTCIRHGDNIYGLLTVSVPGSFIKDKEEQDLFREVVGDIGFALHSIEVEKKHKLAEQVHIETEERFRSLFENISSGVAVYTAVDDGKDFIFIDYNRASEQIDNISRKEVVGKKVTEVFPGIRDLGLLDVFQRVWKTGKPEHHPISFYEDEMITGWRENYVYKLPSGELVAVYDDVTGRKQAEAALQKSEEKLHLAIEGSKIGIWDWMVQTGEMTYNERWAEIAGYTLDELEPISIKTWNQRVHPDDIKRFDKVIKDYFEGRTDFYELEVRMLHKDGHWVWVLDKGKVTKWDPEGNPIRMIGTHLDITHRKQVEKAMIHAKLVAEEANRNKSDFLANMSHELRTPMNSVLGFSDLLLMGEYGKMSEKQKKPLEHVHEKGKYLLSLINAILDISKIEAGTMEVYYERFNVQHVLNDLQTMMIQMAAKKHITIDMDVDPQLTEITADLTKFKEILYNLMENAIKFTPENGLVMIDAIRKDDHARISVTDSGIGITKEDQDRIFEPFIQADGSTSRRYGGTGLGLNLVKEYVKMHGGSVWVESEVGKGSTFTFTIPIEPAGGEI